MILTQAQRQTALQYIQNRLFYPSTKLLYDHPVDDPRHFATPEECRASDPNPCGYGTGMEDCMLSGATMLEACLLHPDLCDDGFTRAIVDGLLTAAESAHSAGFLPRGVTPIDGKSHYIDSSRDQYTMFLYALHLYRRSPLCTTAEAERITRAVLALAERAVKNVTPENDFDLLREDGGRTLCTTMWGDGIENHEMHRLPMFYAAAYEVSGDEKWLARYRALREEAFARALPMKERYYHLYTLQQMAASIILCRDVDPDDDWKARYNDLLVTVAEYALAQVSKVEEKIRSRDNFNLVLGDFRTLPRTERRVQNDFGIYHIIDTGDTDSFYLLQDAPNILIVCRMAGVKPSAAAIELYRYAFSRIDFSLHHRATPIHFLNADKTLLHK